MRGAGRDRHERAVGCSGRGSLRETNASRRGRRSRVVLTPRRWRQVLEKQSFSGATVARKPGHRGEHEISRKPLRRESRIASAGPVCSCAFFCAFVHTRPRVQRASGFPCALLFFSGGGNRRKTRAHRAARSGICVCNESGYCEEQSVRVETRSVGPAGVSSVVSSQATGAEPVEWSFAN